MAGPGCRAAGLPNTRAPEDRPWPRLRDTAGDGQTGASTAGDSRGDRAGPCASPSIVGCDRATAASHRCSPCGLPRAWIGAIRADAVLHPTLFRGLNTVMGRLGGSREDLMAATAARRKTRLRGTPPWQSRQASARRSNGASETAMPPRRRSAQRRSWFPRPQRRV